MEEIILAMKPKYLELILNGTKTAELRRTHPVTTRLPDRLWLYQGGCIHGSVDVNRFCFIYRLQHLDTLCYKMDTPERACVTPDEMWNYLFPAKNPIIYGLCNPVRAIHPIPVSCRPQSWIYMTDEVRAIVYEPSRKGEQQ